MLFGFPWFPFVFVALAFVLVGASLGALFGLATLAPAAIASVATVQATHEAETPHEPAGASVTTPPRTLAEELALTCPGASADAAWRRRQWSSSAPSSFSNAALHAQLRHNTPPLPIFTMPVTFLGGDVWAVDESYTTFEQGYNSGGDTSRWIWPRLGHLAILLRRMADRWGKWLPNTTVIFDLQDSPSAGFGSPPTLPYPAVVIATIGNSDRGTPASAAGPWLGPEPTGLLQMLSLAADTSAASSQVPWASRKPVALWRGSLNFRVADPFSGGLLNCPDTGWSTLCCPRCTLVNLTTAAPDILDARFYTIMGSDPKMELLVQSLPPPANKFVPYMPEAEQSGWKYIVVVDGRWVAFRLKSTFALGAVVLRERTRLTEWWDAQFIPYVHYVPFVLDDASSQEYLPAQIRWLKENDDLARRIAEAGRMAAQRIFSEEYVSCLLASLVVDWNAAHLLPVLIHERSVRLPLCPAASRVCDDGGFSCFSYWGDTAPDASAFARANSVAEGKR